MEKITKLLLIILVFLTITYGNEKFKLDDTGKLDSIYVMQKEMYREYKNVPLANKKYGLELNLFNLLFADQGLVLNGGFSMFDVDRHAEIAFPFSYSNPEDKHGLTQFTVSCHYRHFLGNTQNGMYLSGFAKYANLSGYYGDDFWGGEMINEIKGNESKFGIGIGIGYRKFSYRGLYWGTSLNVGRYILGKNEVFHDGFLNINNDSKFIFNIELLKFGIAF